MFCLRHRRRRGARSSNRRPVPRRRGGRVSLKMDPTGKVYVALQAPFWGNSPETVATQVLAEQLQIDPQDIIVTYSDSDPGLNGTGPGGSRFTVMLAGAVVGAAQQLQQKLIRVAA